MRNNGPVLGSGQVLGNNRSRYILQILIVGRKKQTLRLIGIMGSAYLIIFVMVLNGVLFDKLVLWHK